MEHGVLGLPAVGEQETSIDHPITRLRSHFAAAGSVYRFQIVAPPRSWAHNRAVGIKRNLCLDLPAVMDPRRLSRLLPTPREEKLEP